MPAATTCLLFASLCASCAGTGESPTRSFQYLQEKTLDNFFICFSMSACRAGLWERVTLENGQPHAGELVQPKRLLQQVHSDEEMLHSRLDTRVKHPPEQETQQVSSSSTVTQVNTFTAFINFIVQ